jgi:hypothetical protein
MAAARETADFWSVRLAVSLVPDRGCRFTFARLTVILEATGPDGDVDPPLAVDLFPREVGQSRSYKRSYGITPSLKLAFAEAAAKVSVDSETLRYEPNLVAAGLLTDRPSWTLTNRSPGINGVSELFLLAKARKQTSLRARFGVGAEVRTALGPVPLRRYANDELLDRAWPLTP